MLRLVYSYNNQETMGCYRSVKQNRKVQKYFHTRIQLFFDKGSKAIQCRKYSISTNEVEITGYQRPKKKEPQLESHIQKLTQNGS